LAILCMALLCQGQALDDLTGDKCKSWKLTSIVIFDSLSLNETDNCSLGKLITFCSNSHYESFLECEVKPFKSKYQLANGILVLDSDTNYVEKL